MQISRLPQFQQPATLNKPPGPNRPQGGDKYEPSEFLEGVKNTAGKMSSLIAGAAIGAGVTALATGAMSTGLAAVMPAVLLAGTAGVAIGLYRSRNEKGDWAPLGRMVAGGLHGIGGLAGGLVGKATVLGLAAGGTATGIAAGVGATALAGLAVGYGVAKFVELARWRG